jgi:hypothetical protein
MPPYITADQFIVSGVTVEVSGKKANTNTGHKKHSAPMLIAIPNRPSVHLCGGSGWPLIRLRSTQPIVMMYEDIIAPIVRVTMASSAVVEPILMSDKRIVTTRETITAFKGMFQPGFT